MAKKSGFGKLLTAAVIGAAAAGTWYYLNKKEDTSAESADDFDDFDDFDSEDIDDIISGDVTADPDTYDDLAAAATLDADAEEASAAHEEAVADAGAETASSSRTYVSLDLKKAKEKADQLLNSVSDKVTDTVHKIKASDEYHQMTAKVDKIRNSNEYASVDEQMTNALNKVREVTEKAVNVVGQKISSTMNSAANSDVVDADTAIVAEAEEVVSEVVEEAEPAEVAEEAEPAEETVDSAETAEEIIPDDDIEEKIEQ